MLELFFFIQMETIPEGATVNKTRYKEILGRLCYSIRRKRPDLWRTKNWLLLHDNVPALRSVLVQKKLARQQVPICHTLRTPLISHHAIFVSSSEEVITATREVVRDLPATMFQRCYQQLYQHWQMW